MGLLSSSLSDRTAKSRLRNHLRNARRPRYDRTLWIGDPLGRDVPSLLDRERLHGVREAGNDLRLQGPNDDIGVASHQHDQCRELEPAPVTATRRRANG
jgi:hypothetical protein